MKLVDTKYLRLMVERLNHLEGEFLKLNKELAAFTDKCTELLNERQELSDRPSSIEKASLTLFKKALHSFTSMLLLYRENLRVDAAVILRHLLNLLIWYRRVNTPEDNKSPDYWALRYIEWEWVFEYNILQRIKEGKSERYDDILSREAEIRENYERVKELYIKKSGKLSLYWYGDHIKDCAKDVGLSETYEDVYRTLSGIEHSDYFYLSRLEDNARFRLHCIEILKLNFDYFRNIIKHVADYFDLQDTQCLDDMHQKAQGLDLLLSGVFQELKV